MYTSTKFIGIAIFSVFWCLVAIRRYYRIDKNKMTQLYYSSYETMIFLILIMIIPHFFFINRENAFELLERGLTLYNVLTIASAFATCFYALLLLLRKPILRSNILKEPSFWLIGLFFVYLISSLWSVWPIATAFRAFELFGYYIVSFYMFNGKNTIRNLYFLILSLMIVSALFSINDAVMNITAGQYYSFMSSNSYSLLAAVFLFAHHDLYPGRIWGYILGAILFIGYGSSATLAALVLGISVYLTYFLSKPLRFLIGLPAISIILFNFIAMLFFPAYYLKVFEFISPLLQKDINLFLTGTGRLSIWSVYLNEFINVPFGAGFWSADRMFISQLTGLWFARHAHNGYLIAWIGAGFPGLFCLIGIYLSLIFRLRRNSLSIRRFSYAILAMLFLNSFTYSGIGGSFNPWYFILSALIVLSGTQSDGYQPFQKKIEPRPERIFKSSAIAYNFSTSKRPQTT